MSVKVLLPVPYCSQLDNMSGTGYRECFSSSCAMLAAFPGLVATDDEYNRLRSKYGDTTSTDAQLLALRSLGLIATFTTRMTADALRAELRAYRPVAVGWLHRGAVENPVGGGHWSVVVGYSERQAIHNDPNGEADLRNGGYLANTNGRAQLYSWKNWLPRWLVEGPSSGWAITCRMG
jgi:hypothetical protein